MSMPLITLQETPSEATIGHILTEIRTFNTERSGLPRLRPFTVEVHDEAGTLAGGLVGHLWGYALHVAALWLREDQRRHGLGSQLMHRAEAYARENGARLAYVETLSFQARPFYEKHGYRVFGTIEALGEGVDYYFLSKQL